MLKKVITILFYHFKANFKTLYFNYKQFEIKKAIHLPVKIHRNVVLRNSNGKIVLPEIVYNSMVEIGSGHVGIFDYKRQKTIWDNNGSVEFEDNAKIGIGCAIVVDKNGKLFLGKNVVLTGSSSIICSKLIFLKRNVLVSWDVLIMDSDFHQIYNDADNVINPNKPILVDEACWIGCRCIILKGSIIAKNSIIGSGTIISKVFTTQNCIIAKNPPQVLMQNTRWQ